MKSVPMEMKLLCMYNISVNKMNLISFKSAEMHLLSLLWGSLYPFYSCYLFTIKKRQQTWTKKCGMLTR